MKALWLQYPPVYRFIDGSRVDGYPFEHQDFDLSGMLSAIESGKKTLSGL